MKFKVGDPCVAETESGHIAGIVMAGPDDSGMAMVAYPFLHEDIVSLTYQKVKPEQIHKVVGELTSSAFEADLGNGDHRPDRLGGGEPRNQDRIEKAHAMLTREYTDHDLSGFVLSPEDRAASKEHLECALIDCVTDLAHLAFVAGVDWGEVTKTAYAHFREEVDEGATLEGWEQERGGLCCKDCGVKAWKFFEEDGRLVHEDFYVHNVLWDRACPDDLRAERELPGGAVGEAPKGSGAGFVICIGCFEKRLGRTLVRADFQGEPHDCFDYPPSKRFMDRWTSR